jgi:hypothetical protein
MYKFQKRTARIILEKSFDAPTDVLFSDLNWMKFSERENYKKAILAFKSFNNLLSDYMQNLLTYTENTASDLSFVEKLYHIQAKNFGIFFP